MPNSDTSLLFPNETRPQVAASQPDQSLSRTNQLDILIITGEASGDMHAAKLLRELKATQPQLKVAAMGGKELQAAGAKIIVDNRKMGVMGIVEALKIFRLIHKALKQVKKTLHEEQPRLVILVDYSGFNLRIAKTAKKMGAHVLYYIAPQVWAWRQKRVKKIQRYVDTLAVIFPFEVPFYQRFNMKANFVGHPLATEPLCTLSPQEARLILNLNYSEHSTPSIIALVPGSRKSEIQNVLPILLETAQKLHNENPTLQFVLPKASTVDEEWITEQINTSALPITLTRENRYTTLQACDFAIAASGTVTLELALLEKPMIIVYKGNTLLSWWVKQLIKVKHVGLPNIIAGKSIVPELLQANFTTENLLKEARRLLNDTNTYTTQQQALSKVHQQLKAQAISISLKDLVLKILN